MPGLCSFACFALTIPENVSPIALVIDGTLLFHNDSSEWIQRGKQPCLTLSEHCADVVLTGSGVVDGNGESWWSARPEFRPGLVDARGMDRCVAAGDRQGSWMGD